MQVRTQTLVKSAIIQIDAAPFKQWYQTHSGVELGNRGKDKDEVKVEVKVRSLVKAIVRWAGMLRVKEGGKGPPVITVITTRALRRNP